MSRDDASAQRASGQENRHRPTMLGQRPHDVLPRERGQKPGVQAAQPNPKGAARARKAEPTVLARARNERTKTPGTYIAVLVLRKPR